MSKILTTVATIVFGLLGTHPAALAQPAEFRAMTWNIWHGGKEDGEDIGVKRVVDIIRNSNADIIAMQETYGSGERIAKALGFHFHPRGTNVSILSRYPIIEDISVEGEFNCVGAVIEMPGGKQFASYSIWLPYAAEIWEIDTRKTEDPLSMVEACQTSAEELKRILAAVNKRLSDPKYLNIPVLIAGDFNSMSHLDYSEVNLDQFKAIVDWPTSHVLVDAGFRDSYREVNPFVDRAADRTWSPRFPDQEQDRIDFIYYKSMNWQAIDSKKIDQHAEKFPSDHALLLTTFRESKPAQSQAPFRIATYNIKHGRGMDDVVDLKRTADVLKKLNPDFVALQEVDNRVERSGVVNEPAELGKQLGMHAAFSSFMDLQGGQYGLAFLSRYPIRDVRRIQLVEGNEPRVALGVEVRLPDGSPLLFVNVHFDWVRDDSFRFKQATGVDKFLDALEIPHVLLGDFNDLMGSRTLDLLSEERIEANKPPQDHFTFPSVAPDREIDFIFVDKKSDWSIFKTQVVDEPLASDHRPVFVDLQLRTPNITQKMER